eukprot:866918-Rhodomonas_salina.3
MPETEGARGRGFAREERGGEVGAVRALSPSRVRVPRTQCLACAAAPTTNPHVTHVHPGRAGARTS